MPNPAANSSPGTGLARMDYMAQVVFKPSNGNAEFRLRASNVGLNLKQEIEYPELIDGIVDKSTYAPKAKVVEGDITLPLIHEGSSLTVPSSKSACNTLNNSLAQQLWQLGAQRDADGRLSYFSDILIAYPDNTLYVYGGCVVNTMSWKVTQGAAVEVTVGLIGGASGTTFGLRSGTTGSAFGASATPNYLSPARQVMWSDFVLAAYNDATFKFDGTGVREFTCDLKNDVERYYTLNGMLAPQDVAARKRSIAGMIKFMGLDPWLSTASNAGYAYTNDTRFTSTENIAFGYKIGANNVYFATGLHGVIFNIEEMSLSPNDVFESTVNYTALGDCNFDYESISLGGNPSASALPSTFPTSLDGSSPFGNKTRSAFPTW